MNGRATILMICLLAIAAAAPAYAVAKDNDLEQGKFEGWSDTKDNIKNEVDTDQDPNDGSALSVSSCQLIIAVEVALASLGSSSALGVIVDEDEVVIAQIPQILREEDLLDAERATSSCVADVGPILIDLTTTSGWGDAAAHGSAADVVSALSGGRGYRGGGGPSNDIDQGRFDLSAKAEENIANEWDLKQGDRSDTDNSAVAAANCQAIVAARVAVLAIALGEADGTIEDSDSVTITGADVIPVSDFGFDQFREGTETTIVLENDHTATASCSQAIASITINIRPESTIRPGS